MKVPQVLQVLQVSLAQLDVLARLACKVRKAPKELLVLMDNPAQLGPQDPKVLQAL